MDQLTSVLLYRYKFILYTYIEKTDQIAREVYGTLCNILHGKRICTCLDIYNVQMNQIL